MLKVRGLEFQYRKSGIRAIQGIDFDIRGGEVFGFLGPSGSGKTTTQRILIGLLKGYAGSVKIFGRERSRWGREFFERIGVAFDFPNLYLKLTAYENLKVIGSYYRKSLKDIDALLDSVGLLTDRDRRVEGFSKGMKMRLNFARSILHDPEFLFFDEPTSGLDPVNAKIVKDIIINLKNKGKTIFLTTHNMTIAEQLCDRVAFLVEGRIPVCDSPEALKLKYGKRSVRVEYYGDGGVKAGEFPMEGLKDSREFFEIMRSGEIRTIHSQEATLEDIFIRLTGKELI
jgi:fluoroquinolone transport system ATP-binding protein